MFFLVIKKHLRCRGHSAVQSLHCMRVVLDRFKYTGYRGRTRLEEGRAERKLEFFFGHGSRRFFFGGSVCHICVTNSFRFFGC